MHSDKATEENDMSVSPKRLKIELPYVPAIPLLGVHLKEWNWGLKEGIRSLMFLISTVDCGGSSVHQEQMQKPVPYDFIHMGWCNRIPQSE